MHQAGGFGERVVVPGEKLLLVVVAGPPGQDGAEVQRLAEQLPDHVFRFHTLGRILIMRTPGSVDVVVA